MRITKKVLKQVGLHNTFVMSVSQIADCFPNMEQSQKIRFVCVLPDSNPISKYCNEKRH